MKSLAPFLRRAPATTLFALSCLIVYLAMVATGAHFANPHGRALIAWGGNYRALTLFQPWRLLSAMWIHGGLLHLCMNLLGMFDICWFLERRIGSLRLILVLLLSGLAASLSVMVFSPLAINVGASGAVMGAAGVLLVLLARDPRDSPVTFVPLAVGLALTLGLGLVWHRLDNAAHLGGLVCGIGMGCVMIPGDKLGPRWQRLINVGMLSSALLLAWLTLRAQNTDEYRLRADLPAIHAILQQSGNGWVPALTEPGFAIQQQNLSRCLNLVQGWQNLRLPARQELMAQQIQNLCRLLQQQSAWQWQAHGQSLALYPEWQQRNAQIHGLLQNIYINLRPELEIEYAIEAQIGRRDASPAVMPSAKPGAP